MTIQVIREQINNFLTSPDAEVLAIKGAWGVGKTFSWNKFLLEAKNEKKIALEKYSYVSLFGINSIDSFKFSIFENVVNRRIIGTEANLDSFKENSSNLVAKFGRGILGALKNTTNYSSVIESISFLSLSEILICIDDLERSGDNLSVKDILGLVSQLKEQKKCKLVLLLNDGEEGLDDYIKYKEKVIDLEIDFSPSPEECADIAYDPRKPSTSDLKYFTNKLGIRNIRVLKKIERLVDLVHPLTESFEKETCRQIIQSLTLFSWCSYCSKSDRNVPSLEYVSTLGYGSFGLDDEEIPENEKVWKSILGNYDYRLTDELDAILAKSVERGFFINNEFMETAKKANDQILRSKSETASHDAWNVYHDSFENNQDEVIEVMHQSFIKNAKQISATNLNGTVTLFRELGKEKLASEVIDFYIKERSEEIELFNMKENNFFGDIKDKEIVAKFNEHYAASIVNENAEQVLLRIVEENGWSDKDEIILANTSEEEYYDLFKAQNGRHLSKWVNRCLQFGAYGNASDTKKEISKRVTNTLKRIASESAVNRLRVRKFGIEIDDA